MSVQRLSKYLERTERDLIDLGSTSRKLIIVSDSKGRQLREQASSDERNYIVWYIKPGKGSRYIINFVIENIDSWIRRYGSILLAIWTGTCDLTRKVDRFIDINDRVTPQSIVEQYERLTQIGQRYGNNLHIVFLECPYYSIEIWNRLKGHNASEVFKSNTKKLEGTIDELNNIIRDLNRSLGIHAPKFPEDMCTSRKHNRNNTSKKISYNLLKDGVHPGDMLAKHWLRRLIVTLVKTHCV